VPSVGSSVLRLFLQGGQIFAMKNRRCRALVLGAVAISTVALTWTPAPASGAPTGVTITGAASPTTQSALTASGVSLNLGFSASYDDFDTSQQLQQFVFHLDNDFAFDGTGLTPCPLSSIQGKFHSQAIAACPNSIVGSGSTAVNGGAITAIVDVFYGGGAVIYLQLDIGPGATSMTLTGMLGGSTRGGDFGTQLDVSNIPNTPGLVFTRFDLNFPNRESAPGHHFVAARCDTDASWEFAGDFRFYGAYTFTAAATRPCQSVPAGRTGKRARALKKCKKKRGKAHKKCVKRAKRLPV
jgi:hypothetical protein